MKDLITEGQVSDRDFFLISLSDLLNDPRLAEMTKAVAVADNNLYVQIATLSQYKIKEIIDLKGKRVSIGRKEGLSERHALVALKARGLECDFDLSCENYQEVQQVNALLNKKIEAFFLTDYLRNPFILQVASNADLDLVEIPDFTIERMKKLGQVPYIVAEIDLSVYTVKSKKITTAATYKELLVTAHVTNPSTVKEVGGILLSYPLFGRESLPAVLEEVLPHVEFRSEFKLLIKKIMIE